MAVQFILGRSGTGKTRLCQNQIIDELTNGGSDRPLTLLVPEQATYQAEKSILADGRVAGYSRLNILSFQRLAFTLAGRLSQSRQISPAGQQMAICLIIKRLANRLSIFRHQDFGTSTWQKLVNLITELHSYNHSPDDVTELIEKLRHQNSPPNTIRKFEDIHLVYSEYLKFLEHREFLNPDYQLTQILEKIPHSSIIKGAFLWVDGFSDFTSQELAVLAELLRHTSDAKISLCLDPDSIGTDFFTDDITEQTFIFKPTIQTYRKIKDDIIGRAKIKLMEPLILRKAHRFADCPAIEHIETNIFNDNSGKIDSGGAVKLTAASDQRSEIEFVAKEITTLIRQHNYRYRDVAVIISGLENYRHFVQAVFDDYAIPFFIDRLEPITQHRLIEFLFSAISLATRGYNSRDILSFLKTGLVDIDRDSVDIFENYCLAFDINQQDWDGQSRWEHQDQQNSFDLKFINDVRDKVLSFLKDFRDDLFVKPITVTNFIQAIDSFLELHGIKQKLTFNKIELNCCLLKQLYELLEQMKEIYQDEPVEVNEIAEVFLGGLSQLRFAQIPPMLDQVLVGSIERSRHPELKAVFLVGASQKQFPVPLSGQGVLNESDRLLAEHNEFALSGTLRQQLLARQYLTYIAFTRPSRRLYITWPSADDKGAPVQCSYFLSYLRSLFSDNIESYYLPGDDIENLCSWSHLTDQLCLIAGKDSNDSDYGKSILGQLCMVEELADVCGFVNYAVDYSNAASLDDGFIYDYYGSNLTTSVSRLQTFASCPFKYYAQYILKIKPRQSLKIKPVDMGDFYHKVIDNVSKKLKNLNLDFASVPFEKLDDILKSSISQCIAGNEFLKSFVSHSKHNLFMINSACDLLRQFVQAIVNQSNVSQFKLDSSETDFGFGGGSRDFSFTLDSGRAVSVRGKIDRVDTAEVENRHLGIILDYKLSGKKIAWDKIYHGLDIQLPTYLLAGKLSGRFMPVGAFFMPIEIKTISDTKANPFKLNGIFNGCFTELLDSQTTSNSSPFYNFRITAKDGQYGYYNQTGILRESDFEKLLAYTEAKVKSMASDIISGKIDITPYRLADQSPCGYCEYKSFCRFDWQINKYNFLDSFKKAQLLEKI
jgi:ATP-dependent helicase/nuclease subunit B